MLFVTNSSVSLKKFGVKFRKFTRCMNTADINKSRVVVTGLGIVCPLGVGKNYVWNKILSSEVGITSLAASEYKDIPCKVAAFVPKGDKVGEFNLKIFKSSDFKMMSMATIYALVAAHEAISDSNWFPKDADSCEKTGVAVGTGMVDLIDIVNTGNLLKDKGYNKVSPYFVPRILSNMTAGHIAIKYGYKGPNHSVSTACATGLHSIGDAYNFIRCGHASVMICGSAEAVISPLSIAAFCRMRALSTNFNDKPSQASRPFDANRDGFVMGEGAGILVLESLEHALKRDAKIHAEILGYGLSGDAHHITSPCSSGEGAYSCMKQALSQANISKTDVGYINAHATSTPIGDNIEIKAIYDLFGNYSKTLTVSSSKGAIGHLLGAAGSLEAIFTILSCKEKKIPPNVNLENPDVNNNVNIAGREPSSWPEELKRQIALTNSFGFGGTNASLVISSFNKDNC